MAEASDQVPATAAPRPGSNLPEFTVSDLAGALKRTIEGAYGLVRVRGEIGKVTLPRSGHVYLTLKDEGASLESVCWKTTVPRLGVRPEQGLEVICTGRLTTYGQRSQYQLVIEQMELAGEGALLKMLEERRRRLAAEGLFDAERKRRLPFLPEVIGVVTSPSGAVIRDILHRLADRFPRHVLVWPVQVQGEAAAAQIAAAIAGLNALGGGAVPRPDLLIVARGGGSLEDLMPFNDEAVVRAAAASAIPLISAVGHETDTTLIDHAADRRAPTPTAAAEMAVPVRSDLLADVLDHQRRLFGGLSRLVAERRVLVDGLRRGLGDPVRLLEGAAQRLDDRGERLDRAAVGLVERRTVRVAQLGSRLPHPRRQVAEAGRLLTQLGERLQACGRAAVARQGQRFHATADRFGPAPVVRGVAAAADRLAAAGSRMPAAGLRFLDEETKRLDGAGRLLDSYSYRGVLSRGYAVVLSTEDRVVGSVSEATPGRLVTLRFHDGDAPAMIGGARTARPKARDGEGQGTLL